MSASRKLCLNRKRERELCPEGAHDISDDFQEAATVFRLPKRLRSGKSQGKSKRTVLDPDTEEDPSSSANKDPPDENTTNTSLQDQHLEEHGNETSVKDTDLQEIEKMLCSESEKLCPSCKVIVPSAVFADHFKECLQKFKRTRGGCKKKLPDANREGETNQQKEHQPVLPCPVCKKPFKSKTQRVSHVKACAHGHGLTSEQLLLASRLLEKQTEEWSELGLPSVQQPQNSKPKAQKAVKHTEDLNDPDIAMALAMSRSMVEEEVESRTSREEKLFALGMEDIVNEDRKVKPVLLLPPDAVSSKTSARQMKKTAKNRKGCCRIYNTALVTRSVEERERLISEKVAVLLTSSDTAEGGWANSETPKHSRRLASLVNKTCQLWEAARSGTDEPIHSFYVPDLEPYIIPKETVIGSLFRHLSQVPGRVNTTALHAMDEESESECETETTSEVEDFCTQMVLAELMGSQEEQDHSSETEWEQTSEVMDTQGFLLPSQIAKTQRESKVNTSLLGKFTKGQPSDETLVNIAAEVEQLDDNIHQTVNEAESKPVTPVKTCCTPATHQIYFSKRKEVTPQPDYKNMKSPDLKKELQKYGICALGRKKAVMVLQHVYEQTHPFVTDSEAETSFSQTPQKNAVIPTDRPKLLQSQMRKKGRFGLASVELKSNKKNATREVAPEESALPVEGEREKEESEESQLNSSTSSEGSSGYLFGETVFSPEEEDNLSSTQQADLASQVREMIVSNSDLHRKVLLYEPIFVEDLHAILKSNKTKCSIQALLDVLDDLCLIVRTQANQNRCQIRASKTRKKTSPKKKT
ncbi:hypothetical protein O3P69_007326 [Scylla paramamosain]|uniref:Structure-specific endonuclease subunit SLX4 n=1 Tax=Scylla paramamosain TaxID=85552 RepID=A0AAW0V6X3_SCYPA